VEFGHRISALAALNVSVTYREGTGHILRNFRFSLDERRSRMERRGACRPPHDEEARLIAIACPFDGRSQL
jgi:hypothetical protein